MSKPKEYWIRKDSHKIEGVFYAWNDKGRDKSFACIKVIEEDAYEKLFIASMNIMHDLELAKNIPMNWSENGSFKRMHYLLRQLS